MDTKDRSYINDFLDQVRQVLSELSPNEIGCCLDVLYKAWQNGNRVFVLGNGGSASTASHFAADLNKCSAVVGKKRLKAISLVDNMTLFSALVNDEGWENVFVEQLETLFETGDVVLALSVHGGTGADKAGAWSQNVLKAMQYAKNHGGTAIGFCGFDGGAMKQLADVCVVVPVNSTPLVEAFHVILHHLIAFRLKEKILDS